MAVTYVRDGDTTERWLTDLRLSGEMAQQVEISAAAATVAVQVTRAGEPAPGGWCSAYKVDERGTSVASAPSGQSMSIAPGTYDIGCFLQLAGTRAERWLPGRSITGDEQIEVDVVLQRASLRVLPRLSTKPTGNVRDAACT